MDNILPRARTILATTPQRWTNLTKTVPADLLTRRPMPEEWSAVECLQHVIGVERSYQVRLDAFLNGRDFPSVNPKDTVAGPGEQPSPAELADELVRLRVTSLDQIEKLGEGDLERQAMHPELGPVTLREMMHTWAAHDLNHLMQAEKALMQPFLRGVGPWMKYLGHQVMEG